MADTNSPSPATIIPCLRYRDAPTAIEWLCEAFGFEKRAVYEDAPGQIAHAQLTLDHAMIMLGSVSDNEFDQLMVHPDETAGRATQTTYVIVADPDAHYAQSTAHGARIVMDIKDEDYGGRGYSCLDCEGHLWTFGSYNPWAHPAE